MAGTDSLLPRSCPPASSSDHGQQQQQQQHNDLYIFYIKAHQGDLHTNRTTIVDSITTIGPFSSWTSSTGVVLHLVFQRKLANPKSERLFGANPTYRSLSILSGIVASTQLEPLVSSLLGCVNIAGVTPIHARYIETALPLSLLPHDGHQTLEKFF